MTSDGRLARMKDTIRDVWNSSCGNVYQTVQPTWDAFREYASATTEQIKMHLYSLHAACVEQKQFIQDKLDTLNGRSSAGRAFVRAIYVVAMFFLISVAIECAYYSRPIYWKIVGFSVHLMYLVFIFIFQFTWMVLMTIGVVATMNFVFGGFIALALRSWFMEGVNLNWNTSRPNGTRLTIVDIRVLQSMEIEKNGIRSLSRQQKYISKNNDNNNNSNNNGNKSSNGKKKKHWKLWSKVYDSSVTNKR